MALWQSKTRNRRMILIRVRPPRSHRLHPRADAAAASLEKDLNHLIMGACLASKQASRDTALIIKLENVPNALRDER